MGGGAALFWGEGGQSGDGGVGAVGRAEALRGECLEVIPFGVIGSRGGGDLAEEAAPVGEEAIDVADAGMVGGELPAAAVALEQFAEDGAAAGAVLGGDAEGEVALDGKSSVGLEAGDGEATGPAGFVGAESLAGEEVGEIEEQVFLGVMGIFDGGGDGEPLGAEETGGDASASGEAEVAVEEADAGPLPEEGGFRAQGEAFRSAWAGGAGAEGAARAADQARAGGVGGEVAGEVFGGDGGGVLDAHPRGFSGEKALGEPGCGEAEVLAIGGEAQQGCPGEGVGAAEAKGARLAEPGRVVACQEVSGFVEAAAAGATDHLEQLVRGDLVFDALGGEAVAGDEDRSEREIDAGAEAEGGDDDPELAGFGEGFDESGALLVAESAVVIRDPGGDEALEAGAEEGPLGIVERQRIGGGEGAGELAGEFFRILPVGREDEDGAEVVAERRRDAGGPIARDARGRTPGEVVEIDLLDGDGTFRVSHDARLAPQLAEPCADIVGVGDATAEEQELDADRERDDGALVVVAAGGVGDPLVFVDHDGPGVTAIAEGTLRGLQGGHDDGGIGGVGDVARHDADPPVPGAPLGEFVIGQRAGGDGVIGLSAAGPALDEFFENEGLARAGRGIDDDIGAVAECRDGLHLPGVGNQDVLQRVEHGNRNVEPGGGRSTVVVGWQ